MSVRLFLFFLLTGASPLWGAPAYGRQSAKSAAPSPSQQLADLRHEVNNQETEINMLENRLHNQEMSFEQLRQQVEDDQRENSRRLNSVLEEKWQSMEQANQMLAQELQRVRSQSADMAAILDQYKKKLLEFESLFQAQTMHMASLENALQSLVDVWQAKEAAAEQIAAKMSSKTYKVQSGDSLGKIASQNKVSVQSLKERNHLTSDKIHVGQVLSIP